MVIQVFEVLSLTKFPDSSHQSIDEVITVQEVQQAIKLIKLTKKPGPGGFSAAY